MDDFEKWYAAFNYQYDFAVSERISHKEVARAAWDKALALGEAIGMECAARIAAGYKIARCESHYDDACDRTATLIEEDIREAITNPDQLASADKLTHKQVACEFFRWCCNNPAGSMSEAFDEWWEKRREEK